jgi:uncharacterized RDD family membrane protein YckC
MASEQSGYGGAPAGTKPSGPRAGFWIRFGALLIDGIGLTVINFALRAAVGVGLGTALGILIGLAYYSYFEGSAAGQTIGKKLVGIRVIDFNTGGPLGYGRAAIRYVASFLSSIAIGIGFLWMLWDPEKQTWHDKLSSSVVVPVSSYPVEKWPG